MPSPTNLSKTIGFFVVIFISTLYLSGSACAQMVVSTGTKMVVKDDTFMVSKNDITIENGAEVQLSGTLKTTGNIECQETGGGTLGEAGEGLVILNGTSPQTLSGGIILATLTIDKPSNVAISSGDIYVINAINFNDGYITLGENNLWLGQHGLAQGSGLGSESYAITDGTGEFRKTFVASSVKTFTYPIGKFSGPTGIYSPVSIEITAGDYLRDNYLGARVTDQKYADPNIVDNYLNRYWDLSVSDITGIAYDATFDYAAADVSTAGAGTEADIVCAEVSGSPWAIYNSTDATLHRLSASGLANGGTFTGVNGKVNPPLNRTLSGTNTIPNTTTTCFSAEENLTVGGPGNTFLVEDGGAVDLIAGQSITLLPGTHVVAGGYMHAYISTTFCPPLAGPVAPEGGEEEVLQNENTLFVSEINDEHIVKLYPNPTTNNITMEVINPDIDGRLHFELYNMSGNRLRSWDSNNKRELINLNNYPIGIYLLHVFCGDKSEVARIIKTN